MHPILEVMRTRKNTYFAQGVQRELAQVGIAVDEISFRLEGSRVGHILRRHYHHAVLKYM